MKRLAALLVGLLLTATAQAQFTANALRINQRGPLNDGFYARDIMPTVTDGILILNTTTMLPELVTLGSGLQISSGALSATAAAQVNSDWNAVSGVAQILNRPTLATVATTGAYADLSGRPSLATVATSGAYNDLSGRPTLAAIATSGSASDLASGTVPAARLPALAISQTTGLQAALDAKFATPSGTTAQYVRGDGTLATLPAPGTGTVTSITAGTGLSGGTIITSGTISLPSTGTAGAYSGVIPAGSYVRLRTENNTGTPTFTARPGQETLL